MPEMPRGDSCEAAPRNVSNLARRNFYHAGGSRATLGRISAMRRRVIYSLGPGLAEYREVWRRDRFSVYQIGQIFILAEMIDENGEPAVQTRGEFNSFESALAALERWQEGDT
jgi:hypothetical protein